MAYYMLVDCTTIFAALHHLVHCTTPYIMRFCCRQTQINKYRKVKLKNDFPCTKVLSSYKAVCITIIMLHNLELEDRDLENSLKQIHTHGWHFDKQSQSQNRNLSKEDLIPLLDEQNDTPYFKFINKKLLELIDTAPILELIEIDVETESQLTSNVNTEDSSIISKLIKQTDTDSSALVSMFGISKLKVDCILVWNSVFSITY